MEAVNGAIDGAAATVTGWFGWLRDGVASVFAGGAADPSRPASAPAAAPARKVPAALWIGAGIAAVYLAVKAK